MLKDVIRKKIQEAVAAIGIEDNEVVIERPADTNLGDYSTNLALRHAKKMQKPPLELATEIVSHLKDDAIIKKAEAIAPGFINIWLHESYLIDELKQVIEKQDKYGSSEWGKGKRWLIEHTSPNPNKAMHLGHLRNNVTGTALANIWKFIGVEVIRDCINNNRGIAIAKLMWGYLKFARKDGSVSNTDIHYWYSHQDEWHTPETKGVRSDKFVDELYVQASEDFKDENTEKQVRQMVVAWEAAEPTNRALWKTVLAFSYRGQQLTFNRLHSEWDKVWHEDEHYQEGKDLVQVGLEKGVFRKLADGAILTNLEAYKLPDTIVLKKDGTSLYITQDLALTKLKKDTFKPEKLFWVLGPDHTLAFRQLFAVLEQLGIATHSELEQINFGYMSIKGLGKMSSRTGNVIYIEDLLDLSKQKILALFAERQFNGEDKEDTAEKMGVGAVKYSILKVGRTTATAFDFETSLNLDGDSGPYLQYTYVRARSILKDIKALDSIQIDYIPQQEELALLRMLPHFQEVVLQSGLQYAPNLIGNYLFDLAQHFNLFYQKHQILKSEKEAKRFRLLLTQAVSIILKNGLALLGIETVEQI